MLTPSQRRSWARRGARDIERTIDQAKAAVAAQGRSKPLRRTAAEPATVDLTTARPGDQIEVWTGNRVTIKRVNKASVTATSGTRWAVGEITRIIPADG